MGSFLARALPYILPATIGFMLAALPGMHNLAIAGIDALIERLGGWQIHAEMSGSAATALGFANYLLPIAEFISAQVFLMQFALSLMILRAVRNLTKELCEVEKDHFINHAAFKK